MQLSFLKTFLLTFCHLRRLESESRSRFVDWWQVNSRPVFRLHRWRLQQRRCKCDRNCKTIIFRKELFFLKHSNCRNAQVFAWNPEVSIHLLVSIITPMQLRQLNISVMMSDNGEQAAIQLCYPKLIENGTCPQVYLQELSATGYIVKMCSTCRSDFCNRFAPHENSNEHFV